MRIDFGKTHADYAIHRTSFAPHLFERLAGMGIGLPGQHLLDLGAGTGLLAQQFASRRCEVTLADTSESLLARSNQSSKVVAAAEDLPFAHDTFDVVTTAQCWHWFNRNRAPREILRVLKPTAALAVIYQTYIPLPHSVAEATEKLILQHHPGWRHANSTGINGQVLRDVQSAGFVDIETFSFDVEVLFSHETWRGFIRTTSAVGASMPAGQVQQFDRQHEQLLHAWPARLLIPHRVFVCVSHKPQARI
jgi:SAM-dependent methyltransferase